MGIKSTEDAKHLTGQPGFTRLVANLDGGGVPDKGAAYNANTIRSTWESDAPSFGGEPAKQGLLVGPGAADPRPVGIVTVDDNDFSTGPASFVIGDYEFRAGVDFLVGALAGNTASNIAAAIQNNGLLEKGWRATAVGPAVTIRYPHPGKIRFEARHYGTIVNFTLSTATGLLADGGTTTASPFVTP